MVARFLYENLRCWRQNLKHLKRFRIGYSNQEWTMTDGEHRIHMPWYPYLACHDIEGYFVDDAWAPQPGETVLDAGGCFGEFAIYASKRVGREGRVVMLEPDPKNIARANVAIERNHCQNVTIFPYALWSTDDTLQFATGHDATSAVCVDTTSEKGTIDVVAKTLPSILAEAELDHFDIIKMDIEGAEIEAVKGYPDIDPRTRFSIASYHLVNGAATSIELESMFANRSFSVRSGNPRHLVTYAVNQSSPLSQMLR